MEGAVHLLTQKCNVVFIRYKQTSCCAPGSPLFWSHPCGVHAEQYLWREQYAGVVPGAHLWTHPTSSQHRGSSRLQNIPEQTLTGHALLLLQRTVRNGADRFSSECKDKIQWGAVLHILIHWNHSEDNFCGMQFKKFNIFKPQWASIILINCNSYKLCCSDI